jgi:hypothetical protein
MDFLGRGTPKKYGHFFGFVKGFTDWRNNWWILFSVMETLLEGD